VLLTDTNIPSGLSFAFWANGTQEPPSAPAILSPSSSDSLPVFDLLPVFGWHSSVDPDPFDSVVYKVEVSPKSNFSSGFVKDSLSDTLWSLSDSLSFGLRYWWRVTGRDRIGLFAVSPVMISGLGNSEMWTIPTTRISAISRG